MLDNITPPPFASVYSILSVSAFIQPTDVLDLPTIFLNLGKVRGVDFVLIFFFLPDESPSNDLFITRPRQYRIIRIKVLLVLVLKVGPEYHSMFMVK